MKKLYIILVAIGLIVAAGLGIYYFGIRGPGVTPTSILTTTAPTTLVSSPSATTATRSTEAVTATLTAPLSGKVHGRLVSAKTQEPLEGAAAILCLATDERECIVQGGLTASVDKDGVFEMSEVPPGVYVILYDLSGKAKDSWRDIDQLRIAYDISEEYLAERMIPFSDEFFETFCGGGGGLTIHNYSMSMKDGKVADVEGAFTSVKYGLTMEFLDMKPIMVEVKPGETSSIEIMARATDHMAD